MAPAPKRAPRGPTDSPDNPFGLFAGAKPHVGAKRAETELGSKSKPLCDRRRYLGEPTLLFANYRAPPRNPRPEQELHPEGSNRASGRFSAGASRLPPAARAKRPDGARSSRQISSSKHAKRCLSQSASHGDESEQHVAKRSRVPDEDASGDSGSKRELCQTKGSIPGEYTFASEIETHIACCSPDITLPGSLRHVVNPDRSWIDVLGRDSFSGESMDFLLRGVEDPLAAGYIAGTIHQSLRMHCARLSLGRELTAEESEGLCQAVNRGAWSYAMKKITPTAANAELNRHYQLVCNGIADAFAALGKRQMGQAGQTAEDKALSEQKDVAAQTQTGADATVYADVTVDDSEPISLSESSDNEDVLEGDTLVAARYAGIAAPASRVASACPPARESERLPCPIANFSFPETGSGGDVDVFWGHGELCNGKNCGLLEAIQAKFGDVNAVVENGADENYDPGDDIDGGGVAGNDEEVGHGTSGGGANGPFVDAEMGESEAAAGAAVGFAAASGHELGDRQPELPARAVEEPDQGEKENLAKEQPGPGFEVADPDYVSESDLFLVPSVAVFEGYGDGAGTKRDLIVDSEDDWNMGESGGAACQGKKLNMDSEDDDWSVEEGGEVDSDSDARPVQVRPHEFEMGSRKNPGVDSENDSWPEEELGEDVGMDPDGDRRFDEERRKAAEPLTYLEMAEMDSESDVRPAEVLPRDELFPPEFAIYDGVAAKNVKMDPDGDSLSDEERGKAAGPPKSLEMAEMDSESDVRLPEVAPRDELADLYSEPDVRLAEVSPRDELAEMDSESDVRLAEVSPRDELFPPEFAIYEDDDGQGEADSGPCDGVAGSTPHLAGRRVLYPIDEAEARARDAMRNGPVVDSSPSNPFVTLSTRQRSLTFMRW